MADHLPGYGHGVPSTLVAYCSEHGLHGERSECFVCGGEVEQVAMVAAEDALIGPETLFCLDCEGRAGPSCADYHGHGVATLAELMDAYSNPGADCTACERLRERINAELARAVKPVERDRHMPACYRGGIS
jgi:hypothetical protein